MEKFFPLGDIGKFITIQNKSGMSAKDYQYFQEVIDILFPILNKENIKIVHLGQDSPPLNGVINFNNKTSIGQAFFILKKSLLHFGVDSWLTHAACAEEVPCISLYGSTTIENHSPYHFNPEKSIFLESHRNGAKATFSRDENPKSVNLINPELIASSICKLLNLPFDYPYQTVSIGAFYNIKFLESCPDSVIDIRNLGIDTLIMRMDLVFNEQNLAGQLNLNKCSILTNKPINLDLLRNFRQKIIDLVYFVEEDNNPDFVKNIKDLRIPYRLVTTLLTEKLNEYKFNYIDYNIINSIDTSKPKEINEDDIKNGLIFYKSSKTLLSKGKIYNSHQDFKNSRPIPSFEVFPQQVLLDNISDLYKEKDYILFLKK